MSLRVIFVIVACGVALAATCVTDRADEHQQPAGSSVGTEAPTKARPVHRREIPEIVADDVARDTGALSGVKISGIFHDTGSLDKNKRSLDVQPGHEAEPGCCG